MFASRLAVLACKPSIAPKFSQQLSYRSYATGGGRASLRRLRSRLNTTTTTVPAEETVFTLGRGLVAGSAVLGLGSLCYYGVGLSKEAGAIDKAVLWPDVVKQRIKTTYSYFGASLAFTAGSAVAISRNPAMMNLVSRGGWMSLVACLAALWGTGIYCQSLPYTEGFGKKQLAWMAHSAVVGAVIAPMMALGGPLMLRCLSTLAVCAPSEKFLNMGGPLAMGLGVVFISSIGTWFLPPTGALGAGMYSIAIYGGLVLFGMFLLYDTQKIIKRAETTPVYAERPYDPINNSVGIYLDTVNIFIRIASILAGGGGRRK